MQPEEGGLGDKTDVGANTISFTDIGLPIGAKLQVQPPPSLKLPRVFSTFIGYHKGQSILISMPRGMNGEIISLLEGESLVMRAFVRHSAFAFVSDVMRISKLPYPYLHLRYPDKVSNSMIRKFPRVRTKLVAEIRRAMQAAPAVAVLSNVSASGALVDGRQSLADVNEVIAISLNLTLHGVKTPMVLQGVVRAITPNAAALEKGEDLCHFGIEFVDLSVDDEVKLKSFVYQKMVDDPKSLV